MVYTVTFNPALDYIMEVGNITPGSTNRSESENIVVGGKGINVSAVLAVLGAETTALGFIGGFTGREIERSTEQLGLNCNFIEICGQSRINVKLKGSEETEINAAGPCITAKDVEKLKEIIKKLWADDILVLAGSVPKSVGDSIYGELLQTLPKGTRTVVDASGMLLKNALKEKPFLVKPNEQELEELFGEKIKGNKDTALKLADNLLKMGAENVMVSLGANGAVFVSSTGERYSLNAPKGRAVNTVGAGDSMVAGFIAGVVQGRDIKDAFKMAVATGSAAAFSQGFPEKEKIMELYGEIV